jgi:hypothetical protein
MAFLRYFSLPIHNISECSELNEEVCDALNKLDNHVLIDHMGAVFMDAVSTN